MVAFSQREQNIIRLEGKIVNKKFRIATVALSTVAAAGLAMGLAACEDTGRKISGTYTVEYSQEYVSTHVSEFVGGKESFLTVGQAVSSNTLVFNEDGTYTYTKEMTMAPFSFEFSVEFTGKYSDGTTAYEGSTEYSYILNEPTSAEWSLTPGMTCIAGWGDGVIHSDDWQSQAGKSYTGGLGDAIQLGEAGMTDPVAVIDFFPAETFVAVTTDGMTDSQLSVEVAIDDETKTIIYL